MAMDPHYVPKILSLTLAYAKNGDQQFWKEKFHAANEEAQHALTIDLVFFFLRGGRGGEEGCFVLFFLLFPMCSHHVLKVFPDAFPQMFPIVPGFYPIWFAQSSTPLYTN
jgi:hypothetical protein